MTDFLILINRSCARMSHYFAKKSVIKAKKRQLVPSCCNLIMDDTSWKTGATSQWQLCPAKCCFVCRLPACDRQKDGRTHKYPHYNNRRIELSKSFLPTPSSIRIITIVYITSSPPRTGFLDKLRSYTQYILQAAKTSRFHNSFILYALNN